MSTDSRGGNDNATPDFDTKIIWKQPYIYNVSPYSRTCLNNIVGTGGRYWIREVIELGKVIHLTILTLGLGANIELHRLLI